MRNKAFFLIKQSLKKKMDTKWFKIANVLILIALVTVVNLDKIIGFFGGDFENTSKIYVVDKVNAFNMFESYFNEASESVLEISNYEVVKESELMDDLKSKIEEKKDIIITIFPDNDNFIKSEVISYDPVDTITKQLITSSLSTIKSTYALANSNLTYDDLNKIVNPIEIEETFTNPSLDENAAAKDIISAGSIIVFIIPFFVLIILIVQMIGAEINDEKTTRGMEIIISNVSPKVHFISKIIATTTFAVIQCLLVFVYAGIGLFVRNILGGGSNGNSITESMSSIFNTLKSTGMIDTLIKGLPILILIFLLSFLVYALLAGILASMTTNTEDFQQLQSPLMIIIMIGYYIALMSSVFSGSLFIKIVSYIPFMSCLIAPVTFVLGETTIIDLCITLGMLVFVCYLLIHYGIRIYKVGILNYSSKDLWKKVFKSLKNKE